MSTTVTAPATQAGSRTRLLSWPVIAWGLWDWGSAAFNAVITTFVFTVYLVSDSFGPKADNESADEAVNVTWVLTDEKKVETA